jgi:hypothetical protein
LNPFTRHTKEFPFLTPNFPPSLSFPISLPQSLFLSLSGLIEDGYEQLGKTLRTTLQKKLDGRGKSHGLLFDEKQFDDPPPDPLVPKSIFNPKLLTLNDVHEDEVARQLTIQAWKIFARIKPVELQNQAWSKVEREKEIERDKL